MFDEPLRIRVYDKNCLEFKIITQATDNCENVEDILNCVLENVGIGSIYKDLFGLYHMRDKIWLLLDMQIDLVYSFLKRVSNHETASLELRVRFRVHSLERVMKEDLATFEYLFAQLHHDIDEGRLIYDYFHGKGPAPEDEIIPYLIATNLARITIEKSIDIDDLIDDATNEVYWPGKNGNLQLRMSRFRLDRMAIHDAIQTALDRSEGNVQYLKKHFMEVAFSTIARDTGSENYDVRLAKKNISQIARKVQPAPYQLDETRVFELRVHYRAPPMLETTSGNYSWQIGSKELEPNCFIEGRYTDKGKKLLAGGLLNPKPKYYYSNWRAICDIDSVRLISQKENRATVFQRNEIPLEFEFESDWKAKSFASCLNGYYRLMRIWDFSLCPQVIIPELKHLNSYSSLGPVHIQDAIGLLNESPNPEGYIIRQCPRNYSKYWIDLKLMDETYLSIGVRRLNKSRETKIFQLDGFACNKKLSLKLRLNRTFYNNMKSLLYDIQIAVKYDPRFEEFTRQLEKPCYMNLNIRYVDSLLSVPRSRPIGSNEQNLSDKLPVIIPPNLLETIEKTFRSHRPNGLVTTLARFDKLHDVVIKDIDKNFTPIFKGSFNSFSFHKCEKRHEPKDIGSIIVGLSDWLFIKSPMFATTFGCTLRSFLADVYNLANSSLVQEYFPFGSLDRYVGNDCVLTLRAKLSVMVQVSQMLLYLEERSIIHGKIRCNNLFLAQTDPIHVKLGDPLGVVDVKEDLPYISIDHFRGEFDLCVREYVPTIDVWAAATTMWQLFNEGHPPEPKFANLLIKPEFMPEAVWSLLEKCWSNNKSLRPKPCALLRDICELLGQLEDCDKLHIFHDKLRAEDDPEAVGPGIQELYQELAGFQDCSPPNLAFYNIKEAKVNLTQSTRERQDYYALDIIEDKIDHHEQVGPAECMATICKEGRVIPFSFGTVGMKVAHVVGIGADGCVMKCVLDKPGKIVAAKFYPFLKKLEAEDCHEFKILSSIEHVNVVKILGCTDLPLACVVIDYAPLGDLRSLIRGISEDGFKRIPVRKYAHDIAAAMHFLQDLNVVHCDLALRNILLYDTETVKISDFGLSRDSRLLGNLGCPHVIPALWYAPETIKTNIFTSESDIWSYGVLLWEMYNKGNTPYYSGDVSDLAETLKNERLSRPKQCPDDIYETMNLCWAYEPENRLRFEKISERFQDYKERSF